MLDRQVRLAEHDPDPAAQVPRSRQVGIEQERLVDYRRALLQLGHCPGEEGESRSAPGERKPIVPAELDRFARKPPSLAVLGSRETTGRPAPDVAIGGVSVGL